MNNRPSPLDKFDDATLKKAKLYAYLPSCLFGAHDFLLGRYFFGIAHILIWVIPLLCYNQLAENICKNLGGCQNNNQISHFYDIVIFCFLAFLVASYIWSIIEADKISKALYKRTPEYREEIASQEPEEEPVTIEEIRQQEKDVERYLKVAKNAALVVLGIIVASCVHLFILLPNITMPGGSGDVLALLFVLPPLIIITIGIFIFSISFFISWHEAKGKLKEMQKEAIELGLSGVYVDISSDEANAQKKRIKIHLVMGVIFSLLALILIFLIILVPRSIPSGLFNFSQIIEAIFVVFALANFDGAATVRSKFFTRETKKRTLD